MIVRRHAVSLLVLGLVLIAAGVLLWASGLDLPLHRALRLGAGPRWAHRIAELSALGGLVVMGPVALAAAMWLALRRRFRAALWLFATVAAGRLGVEGLKLLVARPRPPVADRLEIVSSWSFPSSHAAGTALTCLALAALFGRRPVALAVALLVAAVIGWSRVALAVHWPGDVLAGWGVGLAWVALASRWLPRESLGGARDLS